MRRSGCAVARARRPKAHWAKILGEEPLFCGPDLSFEDRFGNVACTANRLHGGWEDAVDRRSGARVVDGGVIGV